MADILARVRLRRATAAQWASINPVLASGEPGYETDTKTLRVGDGVTAFLSLPAISETPPAFPTGGIVMWYGAVGAVPSGWALCDGQNGTPDLRNRFVVGAGMDYGVGDTGGAASVTLTTSQIPSHTHTFSGTTSTGGAHTHDERYYSTNGSGDGVGPGSSCCGGTVKTSSIDTGSAGSHNHTFSGTTAAAGSGASHENRPPYYALAYIMKL